MSALMKGDSHSLLTVHLGDYQLGFDVTMIQEVLTCQQVRSIPCADKLLSGLINLRGQILTAVDLRIFFNLPLRNSDTPPMNIVLREQEDLYGLLVDAVGDVLEVNTHDLLDTPINIDHKIRTCAKGIYRIDSRSVLFLDITQIIKLLESEHELRGSGTLDKNLQSKEIRAP